SMSSRRAVNLGAKDAGADAKRPRTYVEVAHFSPATEIDDDTITDCAIRHAAARSARDERHSGRLRPRDKQREIGNVQGHRDGPRPDARDPRGFRIDRTRVVVGAKCASKSGWR